MLSWLTMPQFDTAARKLWPFALAACVMNRGTHRRFWHPLCGMGQQLADFCLRGGDERVGFHLAFEFGEFFRREFGYIGLGREFFNACLQLSVSAEMDDLPRWDGRQELSGLNGSAMRLRPASRREFRV